MFRNKKSFRTSNRSQFSLQGRSLRYETMEGRLMLSASGFAGNDCAPELDDAALNLIVPPGSFSPQNQIAFQFSAADVVKDDGVGATAIEDIRFILDPDVDPRFRDNGSTPIGATLVKNDQGNTDASDDTWDFSWTPTRQQIGNYRLYIIATDLGGTGGPSGTDPIVPLSDVYAFGLKIEKNPSVDLNGDDEAGIDFGPVAFTEGDSTPVKIVDSDLSIPFVSDDMVASATVQIVSPQEGVGNVETLGIDGGSLVVDTTTPGRLVLSVVGGGLASKADFETALRTLTYFNPSDDPAATRTINITINDGTDDSATAVATVNITGTNDRPDLLQIDAPVNAQVGVEYVLDLVAEDPDGGDLLVFQLQFAPDGAVITPNPAGSAGLNTIQVARDATDGKFHAQIVWTPTQQQGAVSPALFRVSVTDTGSLADTEDYFISTENQDPVANDDPFAVGEDNGSTVVGDILDNDTDADGDGLTVHSASADGTPLALDGSFIHPVSGARITISSGGQITYSPNEQFESLGVGETDTDTFQYTINDGNGGVSLAATVTITINGANDAPTAVGGDVPEFLISEDASATVLDLATLLATATDIDANDVLSIASAPGNPTEGGIFALNAGDLSFDPNGNFTVNPGETETIDFMVEIQDGSAATVMVPARILIEGVNDAPVAVNDPDYTTDEDTTLDMSTRETGVLNNDTDDAGNAGLTVAQVNGDAANVGVAITISDGSGRNGDLTVNANGTFTFDPSSDFDTLAVEQSSQVTFTYIATDGGTESNAATVTITVNGLNDAPVANNDTDAFTTEEDAALSTGANVLDNDTDADGDTLTVSRVDGVAADVGTPKAVTSAGGRAGTLTVAANGNVAFTPSNEFDSLAQDAVDTVMFDYTAFDGTVESLVDATATITINGVNNGPEIDLSILASAIQTALGLGSAPDLTQPIEVPENVAINFDFSSAVSDVDTPLGNLSYSRSETGQSNQPTLDGTGQFSWTPDATNTSDLTLLLSVTDPTVPGDFITEGVQLTFRVIPAST